MVVYWFQVLGNSFSLMHYWSKRKNTLAILEQKTPKIGLSQASQGLRNGILITFVDYRAQNFKAKMPLTPTIFSQTVIFVAITLMLFLFFRIYDIARVIHMNMEIALICAHLCLIAPDMTAEVEICRIISILTHFFFLACFVFMFLEAIHVYAMVASVVHKDGMFTKWQNLSIGKYNNTITYAIALIKKNVTVFLGWGIPTGIVLICVALEYENYGGKYHCWLQMDTK